jgi:PAS domain-containing protein
MYFHPHSQVRVLNLKLQDLVLIEEAFERMLLDYDRVFSAMSIPACLWRRTGEIYKANNEFAELIGVERRLFREVGSRTG